MVIIGRKNKQHIIHVFPSYPTIGLSRKGRNAIYGLIDDNTFGQLIGKPSDQNI